MTFVLVTFVPTWGRDTGWPVPSVGSKSAVGLLALCLPGLMTYDARTNEHAARLREKRTAAAPVVDV